MEALKKMYRPLPYYLTIKQSKIDGLGLFATDNIDNNFVIGITHVFDVRFENLYVRTPLGGFFNHSETPNCEVFEDGDFIKLRTIKDIKAGDEITATYTFYNPSEKKTMNPLDYLVIFVQKHSQMQGLLTPRGIHINDDSFYYVRYTSCDGVQATIFFAFGTWHSFLEVEYDVHGLIGKFEGQIRNHNGENLDEGLINLVEHLKLNFGDLEKK
jgi:hypothetical protein